MTDKDRIEKIKIAITDYLKKNKSIVMDIWANPTGEDLILAEEYYKDLLDPQYWKWHGRQDFDTTKEEYEYEEQLTFIPNGEEIFIQMKYDFDQEKVLSIECE